jgi:hypothetical protein
MSFDAARQTLSGRFTLLGTAGEALDKLFEAHRERSRFHGRVMPAEQWSQVRADDTAAF